MRGGIRRMPRSDDECGSSPKKNKTTLRLVSMLLSRALDAHLSVSSVSFIQSRAVQKEGQQQGLFVARGALCGKPRPPLGANSCWHPNMRQLFLLHTPCSHSHSHSRAFNVQSVVHRTGGERHQRQ